MHGDEAAFYDDLKLREKRIRSGHVQACVVHRDNFARLNQTPVRPGFLLADERRIILSTVSASICEQDTDHLRDVEGGAVILREASCTKLGPGTRASIEGCLLKGGHRTREPGVARRTGADWPDCLLIADPRQSFDERITGVGKLEGAWEWRLLSFARC